VLRARARVVWRGQLLDLLQPRVAWLQGVSSFGDDAGDRGLELPIGDYPRKEHLGCVKALVAGDDGATTSEPWQLLRRNAVDVGEMTLDLLGNLLEMTLGLAGGSILRPVVRGCILRPVVRGCILRPVVGDDDPRVAADPLDTG
jgi:hypothetical protein